MWTTFITRELCGNQKKMDLTQATQKVIQMAKFYHTWFQENRSTWQEEADKLIQQASNCEIRAFQLFYNSPYEALSGTFQIQALEKKDMEQMYPSLVSKLPNSEQYLFIFHCNNVSKGNGLTADSIL